MPSQYDIGAAKVPGCFTNATRTHASTYIHHAGAARVPVPHIHIHIHLHTYTSHRCCKSTCTTHAHTSTYIHHAGAARVPVPHIHIHIHIHLHTYTSCRYCKSATRMGWCWKSTTAVPSQTMLQQRVFFLYQLPNTNCVLVSAHFLANHDFNGNGMQWR